MCPVKIFRIGNSGGWALLVNNGRKASSLWLPRILHRTQIPQELNCWGNWGTEKDINRGGKTQILWETDSPNCTCTTPTSAATVSQEKCLMIMISRISSVCDKTLWHWVCKLTQSRVWESLSVEIVPLGVALLWIRWEGVVGTTACWGEARGNGFLSDVAAAGRGWQ